MMARRTPAVAAVAAALCVASASVLTGEPALAQTPRAELPAPLPVTLRYHPVVALSRPDRSVTACGVALEVRRGEQRLALTQLLQRRAGNDTLVQWCASPGAALGEAGIAVLEVAGVAPQETSIGAADSAPLGDEPAPPGLALDSARCTGVADVSPGLLFQRLFVTGGTLRIRQPDRPTISVTLQRPLPRGLSQAYLNCAGDLFRPEDAASGPE